MPVQITSLEELKAWLEERPREWAQVIALRSALRVFPFVVDPKGWADTSKLPELTFATLRALAVSSAAAKIPADDTVRAAAAAAHAADAAYAAYAYAAAAHAADAAYAASARAAAHAAYAASARAAAHAASDAAAASAHAAAAASAHAAAAHAASDAASTAIWEMVSGECTALDRGSLPEKLLRTHLWPTAPEGWSDAWDEARKWLSLPEGNFAIWREWYHGRLEGLPHAFADFDDEADEKFYRWIVEQERDWWEREPGEVNREITEFVDALRSKPQALPPRPEVDFFISYAKGDEAYLGEIVRALDSLGKTYSVTDRDASKKASRDAIKRAERIIPLYSANYVQSEDCIAEWVHAYNLNTATAEQRIIALRFDQSDLKPLMDGVSILDVSKLLPEQRKVAIAKWLGWAPLTLTRTNVEKTLTTHLDPGVEASGTGIEAKLDTARDAILNEPQLPAQLANAMEALRLMLDLARLSERNLSSMMQSVLKLYDDHFTENGRDSSWGGLDRYMTVISEGTADLSAATMREEKAALEQLIAAHGNCMDALASADEQKRELAHVPVQNADAAAIDGVIDKLKDVAEQAHDQDASTDNYDKEAKNLVSQGRDFAFEVGAPDAAKKPATARMRFLRYVGGFGIRTLSVLGSMASIRQTPEFEKLMQAAEDLVEEFYKLLGL